MKHITKLKLAAIHQLCDVKDKSTEYMYQIMQDSCGVDLDCVNSYLFLPREKHQELFKEVNELLDVVINVENTIK